MGSGKAKKARKAVFQNGVSPETLPPAQRAYIKKEVDRMVRDFKSATNGGKIPAPRMFPCQKLKGKFAAINETDVPRLGDDGLWYIGEELIVSYDYKYKVHLEEMKRAQKESRQKAEASEKNVKELKPEVLGE
jgi:hypothetical protein